MLTFSTPYLVHWIGLRCARGHAQMRNFAISIRLGGAALLIILAIPTDLHSAPPAKFLIQDVRCYDPVFRSLADPDNISYARKAACSVLGCGESGSNVPVVAKVAFRNGKYEWIEVPRIWIAATVHTLDEHGNWSRHSVTSYGYARPDRAGNLNTVSMAMFSDSNIELVLKAFEVDDGVWIFASALTDQTMDIALYDAITGAFFWWRKGPGPAVTLVSTQELHSGLC